MEAGVNTDTIKYDPDFCLLMQISQKIVGTQGTLDSIKDKQRHKYKNRRGVWASSASVENKSALLKMTFIEAADINSFFLDADVQDIIHKRVRACNPKHGFVLAIISDNGNAYYQNYSWNGDVKLVDGIS